MRTAAGLDAPWLPRARVEGPAGRAAAAPALPGYESAVGRGRGRELPGRSRGGHGAERGLLQFPVWLCTLVPSGTRWNPPPWGPLGSGRDPAVEGAAPDSAGRRPGGSGSCLESPSESGKLWRVPGLRPGPPGPTVRRPVSTRRCGLGLPGRKAPGKGQATSDKRTVLNLAL